MIAVCGSLRELNFNQLEYFTIAPSPALRKNGGKRPGAGRPKGGLARRVKAIRDLSDAAMKATKRVPLGTMLKNMNRFDDEADKLYEKLEALRAENPKDKTVKALKDYLESLRDSWSEWRECAMDAQKCAVDAAPFMHQRLSQANVNVTHENIVKPVDMTPEQKSDYYNKLRMRPASHKPLNLLLDNKTGDIVHEPAE